MGVQQIFFVMVFFLIIIGIIAAILHDCVIDIKEVFSETDPPPKVRYYPEEDDANIDAEVQRDIESESDHLLDGEDPID